MFTCTESRNVIDPRAVWQHCTSLFWNYF